MQVQSADGTVVAERDPVGAIYREFAELAEGALVRLADVSSLDAADLRGRLERLLPDLRRAGGLPARALPREQRRRQLSLHLQRVQ